MSASTQRLAVLYISTDPQQAQRFEQEFGQELEVQVATTPAQALAACTAPAGFVALLNAADPASACGLPLVRTLQQAYGLACPVLWWLSRHTATPTLATALREASSGEVFVQHLDNERLLTRLYFLARHPQLTPSVATPLVLRMPVGKRVVDVLCAGFTLLALSPVLLVLAALIKLESRGPVFYYSYRVGAGYQVFKFWKLRSMRTGADQQMASVKNLNQYQASAIPAVAAPLGLCADCASAGGGCQQQLIDKHGQLICELQHQQQQKIAAAPAFIKIVNDPRVTRVGRFLRNTSLDELPQLYNVLRGDMSLVGNRPLPLYEAERLLTDEFSPRFLAPAGITGLWQVSRRGKGGDMSEDERKALDNEYSRSYSIRKDFEIILKTIPALFQKENV